jgi:putative membrane protein
MCTRRVIAAVAIVLLVVLVVALAAFALTRIPDFHGLGQFGGWRMMGGYGRIGGWHLLGAGLLPLLFILGLVFLFAWLVGANGSQRRTDDSALQILRERYARSEITKDEFDQMRRDLQA